MNHLIVSDETLRDGEQQVNVVFSQEEKYQIAQALIDAGIDHVAMMPAISDDERRLAKIMIANAWPVVPDVPVKLALVKQAYDIGARHVTLFSSVSNILLEAKNTTSSSALAQSVAAAQYAFDLGLIVDFALEDATRTDFGFLVEISQALEQYVRCLIVCDTVGCLQPNLASLIVEALRARTSALIGIHCHNDLGLANENTVAAVLAGASLISTTLNGLGERAGNASTIEVLKQLLNTSHGNIGSVNLDKLHAISYDFLIKSNRIPAQPMSEESAFTETGMHVFAMLKNANAYSIIPRHRPHVFFGKYSGISNIRWLVKEAGGIEVPENQYEALRDEIKHRALLEQRSFSMDEVTKMIKGGELL